MKAPQPIEIEQAEVEQLIDQAQQGRLDAAAQKRVIALLRTLIWLQHSLLETRISLSKLRKILFGKRTEKAGRNSQDPPSGSDEGAKESGEAPRGDGGLAHPPASGVDPAADTPSDRHGGESQASRSVGHGRLGAADYPGAERIFCPHDQHWAGEGCPACERGRLYPSRPLVRLRFDGQPLAKVTHYELEQLRCGACGALFVASLPPEAGQQTYAVSLKVNLAVAHYHLGLPFKRIESFQRLVGMPLPDATQWELVEEVADSAYPVNEALKHLGAQQPLV